MVNVLNMKILAKPPGKVFTDNYSGFIPAGDGRKKLWGLLWLPLLALNLCLFFRLPPCSLGDWMREEAPQPRVGCQLSSSPPCSWARPSLPELFFQLVTCLWASCQLPLLLGSMPPSFKLSPLEESHWAGLGHCMCHISSLGASLVY